jgi:DNA-directed RNA polymerase subunit M/transcription elongation factor TFIIS
LLCGVTIRVPVDVALMAATNLAQAKVHGACAHCEKCDANFCFDHIVWKPTRVSETQMTNLAQCPKCGASMGGLPASTNT